LRRSNLPSRSEIASRFALAMTSPTTMHIRQLTEADAEIFRALRLHGLRESPRAFTNSYEEYVQQPLDRTAQRFRDQVNSRVNFTLGAFVDQQLIGCVAFFRETALKTQHKGSIVSLYVRPEYRSQGIARALLTEAIDRARRLPDLEQLLLGVMETQTTAKHLYESLGFVVYGREPRAVKIGDEFFDEEFMVLKL
jgi:ribosomal protein S18 acetylase RimI-like enzyme